MFNQKNQNPFSNFNPGVPDLSSRYSMSPILRGKEMEMARIETQVLDFLTQAFSTSSPINNKTGKSDFQIIFTGIAGDLVEVNIYSTLKFLGLPEYSCNAVSTAPHLFTPTNGISSFNDAEEFSRRIYKNEMNFISELMTKSPDRTQAAKAALEKFSELTSIKTKFVDDLNVCVPSLLPPVIQSSLFVKIDDRTNEILLVDKGSEKSHQSYPANNGGMMLAFNSLVTENVIQMREDLENYYTFVEGQTSIAEAILPSKYKYISVFYLLNIKDIPGYQTIQAYHESLILQNQLKNSFFREVDNRRANNQA